MVPEVVGSNPIIHPKTLPASFNGRVFFMKRERVSIYIGVTFAMIFWALSFIFYKIAYRHLEPIALIFLRLIVAVIFLWLAIYLTRGFEKIRRADWGRFALMAFFEPFLYFMGESYGMTMVSSTVGSVIISTIPLFTPLAAYILYREKITFLKITGALVSFAGVILVVTGRGFELVAPPLGIALMFLAVLSVILYTGTIVDLAAKYHPMTIILVQSILGAVYFLPVFIFTDLPETLQVPFTWETVYPVIFLGVFPSAISFILFTRAIRDIGITRSNIFINFIPVFAAIFSYFILREEISAGKIFGIALVLAGLFLTQIRFVKKSKPAGPAD